MPNDLCPPSSSIVSPVIRGNLVKDLEEHEDEEVTSSNDDCLSVETSFILRQQAQFIAKLNCLERQFQELRQQLSMQQNKHTIGVCDNRVNANSAFVLSDDSGGEFSRATSSDNDELSSLLDQIARISSIKSQGNQTNQILTHPQQHQYLQHVTGLPAAMHFQSYPILVMNPLIAMSHTGQMTSSSSSTNHSHHHQQQQQQQIRLQSQIDEDIMEITNNHEEQKS